MEGSTLISTINDYTHLYTLPNNILEDANVYKRNHDDQLVIIKHFLIADIILDNSLCSL